MYISQVTFEMLKASEDVLNNIMHRKIESAKQAEGAVSAECWKRQDGEKVAYSLVIHWNNEEDFKNWMKVEHSPANRERKPNNDKPDIKKTGAQYEVVEW